jgi:SNF2 family DNA or RNA helicase
MQTDLIVPHNPTITAILAQGNVEVTREGNNVRVPHTLATTLLLRSTGLKVEAPVLSQYDFPASKPAFATQKATVGMMTTEPRDYVLNSIGTGKTRCVLWAYSYLKLVGLANKLVVFAPISTLYRVWARELTLEFPELTFVVVYGDKAKRIKLLAQDVDVYICNHDGLQVIEDQLSQRDDIDAVALDELSVYRNGGAKRTKRMREFAKARYWVWGLTGSPVPKSVTDVWGQCTIVTPWTVPKYFSHIRSQLCYKAGPFKWETREGAEVKALAHMSPSVRFTINDVAELPPRVMNYLSIPLGKEQRRVYDAMRTKALALIGSKQVDALNAGAVLSKLLQIALGWVYTREKEVIQLDNEERIQSIVDFIDGCDRKVITFVPFKSALRGLSEAFTVNDIDHRVVSGDTPMRERNESFSLFQDTDQVKVLLAHPACMAHGLTLTAASTIVWGGPVTSLETFMQANGRITRVGQTHKQLIAMLGGTRVEAKIYALLGDNERVQDKFLELVEDATKP